MTKISVRRPVTTLMVMLIFIAFGTMSLTNLRLALLPNMNIPVAAVITTYQGASPEQIQELVTKPIEQALARLNGLDTLSSTSQENSSFVIMQFQQNVDIDMVAIDIREAVDMVSNRLPDAASTPMVMKIDINAQSMIYLAISSQTDDLVSLKNKVDDRIVDRLVRQNGVASVEVSGGREREIRVDLIENRMRGFGIAEATVSQLLGAENTTMPVGSVTEAARQLTIKIDGQFRDLEEIRNIPVPTSAGGVVYIRDIAIVAEAYKENTSFSYLNGEPSVVLTVSKQSDANDVNMSREVMRELERIRAEYPELDISVIFDPADYINQSLTSVGNSAVSGILLAVLVLYIFMRNVRSTLVIAAAIPLSIMVTFTFMYFANMTLNLMSLGGLTLGVGLLIDNSIVVLESVFRRVQDGETKYRAAINGTREVAMSIVASTLTTLAVFVPVAWLGGMIAQIFNDLALAISFSLSASLLVALTFVPLACSLFLDTPGTFKRKNFFTRFLEWVGRKIDGMIARYTRALSWAINHRKTVLVIGAVFFILSMASLVGIGMELMPAADQSQVDISVQLPAGATVERTGDISAQVMEKLEGIPEIKDVISSYGSGGMFGGGSSSASITVALVPMNERSRSSIEVADEVRARTRGIAGAEIRVEAVTDMMGGTTGGGSGRDIQYSIQGDNIEALIQTSNELIELIENNIQGVRDVSSTMANTTPEATIRIDRSRASSFGLTAQGIMSVVNTSVAGSVSTRLRQGGTEIDIRVGQPSDRVQSLSDLENLMVPTRSGISVPLREVADISITESPASISRQNQATTVTVYAALEGRDLGSVTREINELIATQYIFPQGVSMQVAGSSQSMEEELANMLRAFILAVFLVYAILSAEFESLYYPAVIFSVVPLALSAGIMGLFIMGQSLNITSALGLILLLGIVINNGIVLIDYINLLRGNGLEMNEAILKAGPVRLRAILMTTLTTILALMPMMLGAQEGSEMMQPMATVVVWGLTLSIFITIFYVPCIYIWFERIRTKFFGQRVRFRKIEEI